MNTLYKKNANIRFFLSPSMIKLFVFLLLAILSLPLNLVSGEDAMIPGFRGIIPDRSLQEENGVFQIAFYEKGAWRDIGVLSFGRYYMRKTLALPQLNPSEEIMIRVTNSGETAAQIDAISMGDSAPIRVIISGIEENVSLKKLAREDYDILDARSKEIIAVFHAAGVPNSLHLTARIEPKEISREPFQFPEENNYTDIREDSLFYYYTLNSHPGALSIDGDINEEILGTPFFRVMCIPGSGHPPNDTCAWVMNDSEALYVALDFTPDNTMDGDKDYARVYVHTKSGIREFRVSVPEQSWGMPGFIYTKRALYQHKVYEFKIPLSELEIVPGHDPQIIELSFCAYGTAAEPIINEVDAVTTGSVSREFIEIFLQGIQNFKFSSNKFVLVLYDGDTSATYGPPFDLNGYETDKRGYFVIGGPGVPGIQERVSDNTGLLVSSPDWLQDGPDAVALYYNANPANFPPGTLVTKINLMDSFVYGTNDPPAVPLIAELLNPAQPQVNEDGMGQMFLHSNQRCPNGSGGRRFTYTYTQYFPSPGSLNRCGFTPETVLINEIDVDTAGTTDTLEFIELYDGGVGNTDLTGMALVLYDGAHNLSYAAFDLDGYQTDENGYFLLGTDKVTPMPDIIFPDGTLHDGEDAIALYLADGASFPNGTGVLILWNQLLDAVVYDTNDYDDILLMDILLKDGEPQVDEDAQGQKDIHSLQRCPVGSGGPFVTSTYVTDLPTPKGFVGTPLLMPEPPFTSSTLNRIYWAEVEDALGYIVQCSDTNDFYHILFTEETPGNVQNYLFGPLSGSTPYWYRVRAKNKCLLSKWSFPVSSIQDTIFPESQVVSPDGLTSETLFPVEWTATDPGILPSGVAWVSIFWNKEGGPFQFLGSRPNPITSIPFNTANFGGDGTYRFFSRARDVSGLQEPAPPAPDILVRVDSTPPESHVYEPFGVTTETLVLVKWQVQNPGFNPTAVREVSVFWRKQGNPYELLGKWNVGTIQTEFDAETHGGGGIYHFYSIAVDNAGNEESPPALPDTAVFVWKIQSSWLAY